ncbi:hypothetical protein CK203_061639 [Vitis vinifera]|uniref:Retrotransposon gag domain-containing protein n=1 Tax=Vitis vinifera TaxID=29760 RepID=A0A438FQI2_VITVI|nr:hypothetical protein CK203_061639 [Vitis vinifera]
MGEPSPLRNPLGKRASACVEVMTTLYGSTPSPWRRVEGCVLPESTIASARGPLTHPFYLIEPPQPHVSRRRTWDDLAQKFLRQFAFDTVIDVSRREFEALRQRLEKSITSFISRWKEKIS